MAYQLQRSKRISSHNQHARINTFIKE